MNPKKKVDEDLQEYSERYIRWQGIRIEQVGFVNNLIIGLASGILLWEGNFLLTADPHKPSYYLFIASAFLLFISVALGCLVAWNRLMDFRLTAKVLRSLLEDPPSIQNKKAEANRNEIREEAKRLGETTWQFLPLQMGTFLLSLFVALMAVIFQAM